jgi:hypothetical protein
VTTKLLIGYVYALCDPRGPKYRCYIGSTGVTIQERMNAHLRDTEAGSKTRVHIWMRRLLRANLLPIVEILYTVQKPDTTALYDELRNIERGQIHRHLHITPPLLNERWPNGDLLPPRLPTHKRTKAPSLTNAIAEWTPVHNPDDFPRSRADAERIADLAELEAVQRRESRPRMTWNDVWDFRHGGPPPEKPCPVQSRWDWIFDTFDNSKCKPTGNP